MVLKEADKFYFSTTIFLSPYSERRCEEKEDMLMRKDLFGVLNCTSVHVRLTETNLISVQAKLQGHEANEHRLNFSQWFSFYQRQDGLVRSVIHFACNLFGSVGIDQYINYNTVQQVLTKRILIHDGDYDSNITLN